MTAQGRQARDKFGDQATVPAAWALANAFTDAGRRSVEYFDHLDGLEAFAAKHWTG